MAVNVLTSTTTTGLEALPDVAEAILNLTKSILPMFNEYPLNVFLGATLLAVGIGVFRKLKRA